MIADQCNCINVGRVMKSFMYGMYSSKKLGTTNITTHGL